jgi:hypothetical protein
VVRTAQRKPVMTNESHHFATSQLLGSPRTCRTPARAGRFLASGRQPAWCALDERDVLKKAAVYDAAQHWALRLEVGQAARCEASRAIAGAQDWAQVARAVRNRTEFYADRPFLKRRAS